MKCLTICQPFAHLLLLPDTHQHWKGVENRRWPTRYRGPLLIHAGKSKSYLRPDEEGTADDEYGIPFDDMEFGAIIGVATLADCFQLGRMSMTVGDIQLNGQSLTGGMFQQTKPIIPASSLRRFPWLEGHQHVEGPYCFVMTDRKRFVEPIPYRGAQGLFDVPDEVVQEAIR